MKKIKIEDITPNLGTEIIKELNQYFKIPDYGVVAGQSVASILFKMLGLTKIGVPINDIDIFIPLDIGFKQLHTKITTTKSKILNTVEIINPKIQTLDDYNGSVIAMNRMYKILSSEKIGLKNNIYVELKGSLSSFYSVNNPKMSYQIAKYIIDDFDINAVQCGIDLISKKLYISKNFIDFIKSQTLQIKNYKTPIHSIIRLETKAKELGVGYDNELTKKIVLKMNEVNTKYYQKELRQQRLDRKYELDSLGITTDLFNIKIEQPYVFWFGETYFKKFKNVEAKLPMFNLETFNVNTLSFYTLKNKENVFSNLDSLIEDYLFGENILGISQFDRVGLLLRNLPSIITSSSLGHKSHHFIHNRIQSTSKTDVKNQKLIQESFVHLSIPCNDSIVKQYIDRLSNQSSFASWLVNLDLKTTIYWLMFFNSFDNIMVDKTYPIDLAKMTIFEFVDLFGLKIDTNILTQFNIVYFESSSIQEITMGLKDVSDKSPKLNVDILYYMIQEKLDKEVYKSILTNVLSYNGIFGEFLLTLLLEKLDFSIENPLELIEKSMNVWYSKELIGIFVSKIITTQVEFLELKNILTTNKIHFNDYLLNSYLLKNPKYHPQLKKNILSVGIIQINTYQAMDDELWNLFDVAFEVYKQDTEMLDFFINNITNQVMLKRMFLKSHHFLSDEKMIKLITTIGDNSLVRFIRNKNILRSLKNIGF